MSDMTAEEIVSQLRDSFVLRIRAVLTYLPAHEALQLADSMCDAQLDALAGLRVQYRARADVDGAAIMEDWRRSLPVIEIMRRHGCSRSTAYKYHPNSAAKKVRQNP